jgi:ubiquinone/menaquinone biosynthesis C-methylase UbiE
MKELIKKLLPKIGSENESLRSQWIEKTLKDVPAGLKILDAGAGESQFKKFCSHLKYTSQDFGQYDGTGDKKGLQTKRWDNSKLDIVSDITNIPVSDKSFDAILCTEVFEHIPNPILALKEFSRILKPKGYLIITAPFCSLTHFAPYHFYSGFNRYFFQTQLKEAGFEIKEITPNGNFFSFLAQEIKRLPYITENHSKRKLGFFQKVALFFTLIILSKLNKDDINSSEVLCFGYFILARKK